MIAEFPSGFIEDGESLVDASIRELKEEVGYTSSDFYLLDQAYSMSSVDSSITYIVFADNCYSIEDARISENEILKYGLFTIDEIEYMFNNNYLIGAMNRLAYFNYTNSCFVNNKIVSRDMNKVKSLNNK